jgi:hypothetical protein
MNNWLPLLALVTLWFNQLAFRGKSGWGVVSVIFWVLFGFFSLMALMGTIFMVFTYGDREKQEIPVTIGQAGNPKEIAIIYHPGGSDLPKKVNTLIAEKLAQNGTKITLYTANAQLKIDPRKELAVGFASPVYGGSIRPPLLEFIQRTELTGVKCFVMITGWAHSPEVEKVKTLIESKGGIYIGGRKFTAADLKQTGEIDAFIDEIKTKF